MLLRENQFDHVTDLFYEAAAVPELVPKALQQLAESCKAAGAVLYPLSAGGSSAVPSPGFKDLIDEFLANGWLHTNPNMQRGMALTRAGWKGLITSQDMYQPEELLSDPYLNEYAAPRGIGPVAGMVLASVGQDFVMPITIERRLTDGYFTRAEVKKLNRLMARLQPAAVLALKFGFMAAQRIADGFGHIGQDVALFGGSGGVLHFSPSMERHFADALAVRNGRLSSWEPGANRRLNAAIQRVVSHGPAAERIAKPIALPRKGGRRPLLAQIIPIAGAGQDIFMLARALLIITDPDDALIDPVESIVAAFGLSSSEARLAMRIAAGEQLKDIADAEKITIETARSRLKSVFFKTGTHRQTALAVLINGRSRNQ